MKLIVGLGNPGAKYIDTLHNLGFKVVEKLASVCGIAFSFDKQIPGYVGKGKIGNEDVVIVKPSTFVNESGRAVLWLVRHYNIPVSDLIVISDDLDLPQGRIRVRKNGSSGGQKGVSSIIEKLQSPDFIRVRIGIGRPPEGCDPVEYVLTPVKLEENAKIKDAISRGVESIITVIKEGLDKAMNVYNRRDAK